MGEGSDAALWITWATRQADRLDPLVTTAPPLYKKKRQQSFWDVMSGIGRTK